MDRRELIKLGAGAVVASKAYGAPHKFFTPEEYAVVDELTEMIIPADAKSGGAKAAKVADYIDVVLGEAFEQIERDEFRAGLTIFVEAPPDQRLAMLTNAAANEKRPETAQEKFFRLLKEHTVRGYYTSKIGIHDEMEYKGNSIQSGVYAGFLPE
jgi:gluconate 2-dehydrogenase gamma chain